MQKKIAILTDTNSGITQKEAKTLGIHLIPTPFFLNDREYLEGITMQLDELYVKLKSDIDVKTSQPSPGSLIDKVEELLKSHDEIVYIPISAGLSGTYSTGKMMEDEYENKLFTVDNRRVSGSQKSSVLDAIDLVKAGKTAKEIRSILEAEKDHSIIYLAVESLDRLKKGGRVTPGAAALATILNIKPILIIGTDKIDSFAKVRGFKAAKRKMIEAVKADIEEKFKGEKLNICAISSAEVEDALTWTKEVSEAFPEHRITTEKLSASVACHTGVGCVAISVSRAIN